MSAVTALRLPPGLLGATAAPLTHTIAARWLMAYAAGLGETAVRWYDTLGSDGLAKCALSQIRDWKFPPIASGVTTFQAPFVFTPPN